MPRHGLARTLSKLGYCSRSQAERLIAAGQVQLNGIPQRNPETPVIMGRDRITVEGKTIGMEKQVYLILNKPRGLVTTRSDEKGRPTVYACFKDPTLPFLSPVGRLDQASEGLLLFTNDTQWAARIADPGTGPSKTYHVQVDRHLSLEEMRILERGVKVEGEVLAAESIQVLRQGEKNAWLEVVLNEGKNRQIRRLLQSMEVGVMRLIRVAIGGVELGVLAKGSWRHLTPEEVAVLSKG